MKFHVVLNRDGGTLRTIDIDAFVATTRDTLKQAGHSTKVEVVPGSRIEAALDEAVTSNRDVVMVGGGDGTVSAAAAKLKGTGKALAILPAGTMNLFARSLGIPLQLEAAVQAFAKAEPREVDLASANGRVFVHQFSIGLHTKLIRLRERRSFQSRLGKMRASVQAGLTTFVRPPRMRVGLTLDGVRTTVVTAGIGVTNNPFGEGHLPYADMPDGGLLGIYITRSRTKGELARFVGNLVIGRWQNNAQVDIYTGKEVVLSLPKKHRRFGCAMDGELYDLELETVLKIHPRSLVVLVPQSVTG